MRMRLAVVRGFHYCVGDIAHQTIICQCSLRLSQNPDVGIGVEELWLLDLIATLYPTSG